MSSNPPGDGSEQPSGRRKLRHELRTPLNQIIGYSELLQEEVVDVGQERLVPDLNRITGAARNMLQLIEHLFDANAVQPLAGMTDQEHVPAPPKPLAINEEVAELTDPRLPRSIQAAFGSGRHVLVVDDDPRNVDFLTRQLMRRGFFVTVAGSGPEALELTESRSFDLVLLDVLMPGMSGLEVLQRIRTRLSAAELPVVMATALDRSDDVVQALQLGANDYVTKPLDLPVVLARLQNQLELKRAREQIHALAQDLDARNRLIRAAFGRFMSEDVVKALLETPEGLSLGGTRREVTILMSDLRGFTQVADRLQPDEVMRLLNDYLGVMVEVVDRHRGTIIEFIGDAILVLFGAPLQSEDDARRAIACAIDMQRAMTGINDTLRRRALPSLEMGIALNTGEVIVGNIGSLKRSKYGVVGRHVNLTARIESFGVGGQILASAETVKAAGPDVVTGPGTRFKAKGFADPIEVLEVQGLAVDDLYVPRVEEAWTTPPAPLEVTVSLIDGKVMTDDVVEGALYELSATGAKLRCELTVQAFDNLRLRVRAAGGEWLEEDVYAKVLDVSASEGIRLRFTSVPPRASQVLSVARG